MLDQILVKNLICLLQRVIVLKRSHYFTLTQENWVGVCCTTFSLLDLLLNTLLQLR